MPDTHQNNFDFIRLFAAVLVIFGHAYNLNGYTDTPLSLLSNSQIAEHGIGVYVFFAISGFLICKSYLSRNDPKQFLKARALRIIPGMAVAVLLTVFVLGPLVTDLSLKEYFTDGKTWHYLKNILPWNVKYQLPGVFQHNTHGVNGSLWTIPLELRCYLAVLVLGVIRLLKFRFVILALFVLSLVGYCGLLPFATGEKGLFYVMFLSGSVFYLFHDKIPYRWYIALICLTGLCLACNFGGLLKLFPVLGTYLIIYVAYLQKLKLYKWTRYGDFSYGIYIYAFPIQQLLIHLKGEPMSPWLNFIYTMPICLICAVLSWYAVEKPALSFKGRKQAV